jgi:chaperonin GroES
MSKIHPFGDKILVRRQEPKDRSKGGIILPDTAKEKPQQGEVLAVGPGKLLEDGSIAHSGLLAGQLVVFGSYSGVEVEQDGEKYLLISQDAILAVIQPTETNP